MDTGVRLVTGGGLPVQAWSLNDSSVPRVQWQVQAGPRLRHLGCSPREESSGARIQTKKQQLLEKGAGLA